MPSDQEVLDTKMWTLAKYLDDRVLREHFNVLVGGAPAEVVEVRIDMTGKPFKVTLALRMYEAPTVATESSEGDVCDGRCSGLPSADASAAGSETTGGGRPKGA